jgi:phospholipase/carboxylesterase
VLIAGGRLDPIAPAAQTERSASYLCSAGANVTLRWENAGHELTQGDVDAVREWWREESGFRRQASRV